METQAPLFFSGIWQKTGAGTGWFWGMEKYAFLPPPWVKVNVAVDLCYLLSVDEGIIKARTMPVSHGFSTCFV